jgi:hypothetical protein
MYSAGMGLLVVLSGASLTFGQTSVSTSDQTTPITPKERVRWVFDSTLGPTSLLGASVRAGISTWENVPDQYGPHWDGFAKRVGINVAGSATSNTMEAGLGAAWGEDPRYSRVGGPFKNRLTHIFTMVYMAKNRDGELRPAYARFVAIPSSNFLSNTWRTGDDATVNAALSRTAFGFLGRLSGNAFSEFWPDLRGRMFRKHSADKDLKNAGVRETSSNH